jgi:hypothetical protein
MGTLMFLIFKIFEMAPRFQKFKENNKNKKKKHLIGHKNSKPQILKNKKSWGI